MVRASCDDHPAFPWQTSAAKAFPWQHRAPQMILWLWNKYSTGTTNPKQHADFLIALFVGLICITKSSVCTSSCRFCLWPRCSSRFPRTRQIQTSFLCLNWFFYWQSVFGMKQIYTEATTRKSLTKQTHETETTNQEYSALPHSDQTFNIKKSSALIVFSKMSSNLSSNFSVWLYNPISPFVYCNNCFNL